MTAAARPWCDETGCFALFSHGFRPFFLLAGIWAPIGVVVWVLALAGAPIPDGPLPMMRWHAHELLAGFVGAAMVGFLLTAIPNWTGCRPYSGAKLAGLAALFLLARLLLLPGSPVPIQIAAPIALAALPCAFLLVLPDLIKARSARAYGPPALVLAFWTGDLLMLGEAAEWWTASTWASGQLLMADAAMLLVGLIGGRIIPAFTMNVLRKADPQVELRPLPGVDRAAIVSLAAVAVVDLAAPGSQVAGIVAAVAAILLALRLSRWHGLRTLGQPILWVLHLAYALLPAALALKAIWLLTAAPWAMYWLHLQMAGGLALMILAVMTRAALGHTGRKLAASPSVVAAYVALLAAVLLRVFGPGASHGSLLPLIAAAAFWCLAFVLFLSVYAPILAGPRAETAKP